MAPPSVGQTFALAVSARGGHPAGNEASLIADLRARLNHPSATESEVACRAALAHSLSLVVVYLQRSTASDPFSFVRGASLAGTLRYEQARFLSGRQARVVHLALCEFVRRIMQAKVSWSIRCCYKKQK